MFRGAQEEVESDYSDYRYMSFDMGKTWYPLSTLIDDYYTWSTTAISNNKYLGEYITLSPSSGTIDADQSETVGFDIDGSTLINGTYSANLLVESNDTDEKETRLSVGVTVANQKPDLRAVDVVDFGSVFYGKSKTLVIPVTNFGYGNFYGVQTAVSDDQFKVTASDWCMYARDYGSITVKYTPNGAGNDNGVVTLTDLKGNTFDLRVFGVGANPSKIELTPSEQTLEDMGIGQTTSTTFTISNTGEYPLNYSIPVFKDGDLSAEDSLRHRFGYTYESNINDNTTVTFEWDDITESGVDVTDYFKNTYSDYTYKELDLGFEFPFYNKKTNSIYITRYGILSLSKEGSIGNCAPPSFYYQCSPEGAISAMGWPFDLNRKGTIHYKKESDRVIIQYTDVFFEEVDDYYSGTFQIVLYKNGDIDFRYKDIEWMDYLDTYQALIGMCNPEYDDEFRISGADFTYGYDRYGILSSNETIFKVKYPGSGLVESVSKTSGYIVPGESEEITVNINTANVNEGVQYQNISILSNDPFNAAIPFTVNVNVNSGGVAEPKVDRTNVDFGQVFTGALAQQEITIVNTGNKDVEIVSADLQGDGFSMNEEFPRVLGAKSSQYLTVSMLTDAAAVYDGQLTINCSDGTTLSLTLNGEVKVAPQVAVNESGISETLNAGDKMIKSLQISNDGDNPLELLIKGNDWIYEDASAETMSVPDFAYYYSTSDDAESGVMYNWEDIVEDGSRTPYSWYSENEQLWKEVELPFDVKLYNKASNKIWISWQGMITTVEPQINATYIIPGVIPNPDQPNSLIAPYLALHKYDEADEDDLSGIYYKIYDDRIVVQWNECIDMYGLGTDYNFEAIIYNNGIIKYQYQGDDYSSIFNLGLVGLENENGDEGVQIVGYQYYLKNELAIVLTPSEKVVIPAKESKTINIALDASLLNDGFYSGNIEVINNTPDQPDLSIPVSLNVIGEPSMEAPEAIDFGTVMAYDTEDDYGYSSPVSYTREFELVNTGTAAINFSSLILSDNSEMTAEWYVSSWGYYYWSQIPEQLGYWDPTELLPGESRKLRINFTPSGDVTDFNVDFTISSNLNDVVIPVTAHAQKAPVVAVEGDDIEIIANSATYTESRSLTLSNVDGQGSLSYNLSVDYNRAGADASAIVRSYSVNRDVLSVENQAHAIALSSEDAEVYDNVLEYDSNTEADALTGYGEGSSFAPCIAFEAPAEGFKLSHVQTWYNPVDLLSSDITVYVLAGGADINEASILTQETYTYSVDETIDGGSFITIPLSEPQQFYPNEKFYIVVAYPFGVEYPQGTAFTDTPVAGRFFFEQEDGWEDVTSVSQLEDYMWMIKAIEKEHATISWVNILTPMSGEVEAEQTLTIDLDFNAAGVMEVDNYANLIVESNDPTNPTLERTMHLHMNQAPVLTVDPDAVLTVDENSTLTFDVIANDSEGDDCTFELAEENSLVSIVAADNIITVTYTPDYFSAGNNVISITGTDEYNNSSVIDIPVEVVNVNRVPEISTEIEDKVMVLENGVVDLDLSDYITDPDNDVLTFDVTSSDYTTLDIFLSGSKLKMDPLSVLSPDVEVSVTATDEYGASVDYSFIVHLLHRTGINDNEVNSWVIYPNPAASFITIQGTSSDANVQLRIVNVAGTVVIEKNIPWYQEQKHTISVDELMSGVYLVEIQDSENTGVYKLIKK